MKRMLLVALLLLASSSMLAADSALVCAATDDDSATLVPSLAIDFPVIALNQKRPIRIVSLIDIDPNVPIPPDEPGWQAGACNCKRRCPTAGGNCKLSSDWMEKCKSSGPGTCIDCDKDCGG